MGDIYTIRSNILKVETIPTWLIISFEQLLLLLLKTKICQLYIIVLYRSSLYFIDLTNLNV